MTTTAEPPIVQSWIADRWGSPRTLGIILLAGGLGSLLILTPRPVGVLPGKRAAAWKALRAEKHGMPVAEKPSGGRRLPATS